ncbi:urease accessory protein UreD [Telmatospirillum sp.]|uniref:urease accessory protein UreD n=1 Tax=Telmatospirillum sp. TaxID=2079197 RepID=UPI00283CC616|nr:urease accessory protein UreD [Telmatospirillum sp.]MDR3439800.1 urease accessory protein UreD [Telmatospirillum sp.]
MFGVISPSDVIGMGLPTPLSGSQSTTGMHGSARVRLRSGENGTTLEDLHQSSPLRVLFPIAADGDPLTAALITTSGGLVGGDSLTVDLAVGENAQGLFVAQAAEKIYRSTGADGRIDVRLTAGPGGWLEFLPQETILFDNARLRRNTDIDVPPGGRLLAGEILVFGRTARGERMARGLVRDSWKIRRGGRLVWHDALHLDGDITAHLDNPAGFGGCHAAATLALVADDASRLLAVLRSCVDDTDLRFGATIVNGILVGRWLAADTLALRRSFGIAWGELRAAAGGWPKTLPRLWHI